MGRDDDSIRLAVITLWPLSVFLALELCRNWKEWVLTAVPQAEFQVVRSAFSWSCADIGVLSSHQRLHVPETKGVIRQLSAKVLGTLDGVHQPGRLP